MIEILSKEKIIFPEMLYGLHNISQILQSHLMYIIQISFWPISQLVLALEKLKENLLWPTKLSTTEK